MIAEVKLLRPTTAAASLDEGRGRSVAILEEVIAAVERWPDFAAEAKLADILREKIQKTHRLAFPKA